MQYGSSGEYIKREGEHEQIRRATKAIRAVKCKRVGRYDQRKTILAHDTDSCHEPADPMCVHWAGEGLRPLDPRTEIRRRCAGSVPAADAAVAGPRPGRIMNAGRSPASGSARSATAAKALRASSASALRADRRGRRPYTDC